MPEPLAPAFFSAIRTMGRTDVLLLTKKLELDFGILVAVDRFATGATAHNLRELANAYVLACENGQPSRAAEYRNHLLRELGRPARAGKKLHSW